MVIFQMTRQTKYIYKMMYIVAYFKRLWKKKIKEAQLEFCLINISGWLNRFIPNNWFNKTIIILNKENINLFVNTKSDEFLWETILQNILSLCNSKKTILQAAKSTLHDNCNSTIGNYQNIS